MSMTFGCPVGSPVPEGMGNMPAWIICMICWSMAGSICGIWARPAASAAPSGRAAP